MVMKVLIGIVFFLICWGIIAWVRKRLKDIDIEERKEAIMDQEKRFSKVSGFLREHTNSPEHREEVKDFLSK